MANGTQEFQIGDIVFDRSIGREVEIIGFDAEGNPQLRPVATESATEEPVKAGFLRTAAQGATLGFSDELAGVGGLLTGQGYKSTRDKEREKLAAYAAANPGKAMLAELAGGVLTGGGLVGGGRALGAQALRAGAAAGRGATRAAGTGLARTVAPRAAQAVRTGGRELTEAATQRAGRLVSGQGKTLTGAAEAESARRKLQVAGEGGGIGSKLLTGAKIGGLEGAAYGIGTGGQESRDATLGESLKDRAIGGLRGGAVGATFGVGLGAAGAGLGKGLAFVKDLTIGQGGKGAQRQALRKVDEAIAMSKMQENPRQFKLDGDDWVQRQKDIADGTNSTAEEMRKARQALEEWETSGRSEVFAGIRAQADDALARERQPGAVKRLLADSNEDLGVSAQAAASVGGQQTGLLKTAMGKVARGVDAARDTIEELAEGLGVPRRAGSAQKTYNELLEGKRANARSAYDDWDVSYKDDEFKEMIVNADGKAGEGFLDVVTRIRTIFSPRNANDTVGQNMYKKLIDATGSVDESSRLLGAGKKHPMNLEDFLENPAKARPKDIDMFRRALLEVKDQYAKEGTQAGSVALKRVDDLIERLDDAIDPHAPKYKKARQKYQVDSRKVEAYEGGARKWDRGEDLADAYENAWKGKSGRTQRNLTDAQKNQIRNEFKQGVVDKLSDDISALALNDDAGSAAMNQLQQRVKTIVDAGLIDESEGKTLLQNVTNRANQAKTSKSILNSRSASITDDAAPEGAVEATGALYGAAGQAGAMGRTLVASQIYTKAYKKQIAEAAARRLRQKESSGLLRVADSIKELEPSRVRAGLTRKGLTGGLQLGLISPFSEDKFETGQKDFLYRPGEVARRRQLERYGLLR